MPSTLNSNAFTSTLICHNKIKTPQLKSFFQQQTDTYWLYYIREVEERSDKWKNEEERRWGGGKGPTLMRLEPRLTDEDQKRQAGILHRLKQNGGQTKYSWVLLMRGN